MAGEHFGHYGETGTGTFVQMCRRWWYRHGGTRLLAIDAMRPCGALNQLKMGWQWFPASHGW
jgi:hypothetical protein